MEHARNAALLKKLLEAATDGIWLRDADGIFQVVNAAAAAIMGRPADDVIGRSLEEIWPNQASVLRRQAKDMLTMGCRSPSRRTCSTQAAARSEPY